MKKLVMLFVTMMLVSVATLLAQDTKPYAEVAKERAEKIVAPLKLTDIPKRDLIKELVAQQYIGLNKIHAGRDERLKSNPRQTETINKAADKQVAKQHVIYLRKLKKELDEAQIAEIKNGMTYHTVPITYANYLLMLPYLSKEDQDRIWAFLIEARERAMDGGTSKEKHAWFNKYKGKIANHLAAKGYDLKHEGTKWAKRRNVKSTALEILESNKVMSALNLADQSKSEPVRNLIAYQYQQIMEINAAKIARQKAAEKLQKIDAEKEKQAAWEESKTKLDQQRERFVNQLLIFLSNDQVEIVKNEMTGQGLQKETARFQELLPNLTVEHKARINDYLLEARENAMNVLSNRERNQWFAKYRGRANNYLSKQGYDLRKATEALKNKNR